MRAVANRRLAERQAPPLPAPAGSAAAPPASPFSGHVGHIRRSWLLASANDRLNALSRSINDNLDMASHGDAAGRQTARERMIGGVFGKLPATIFVLVPLFALLLSLLAGWLAPRAAWIGHPLRWLRTILLCWVPAYLLLMQKRIYRQGWPMTVLKYWCIGSLYVCLLCLVLVCAVALGLAN